MEVNSCRAKNTTIRFFLLQLRTPDSVKRKSPVLKFRVSKKARPQNLMKLPNWFDSTKYWISNQLGNFVKYFDLRKKLELFVHCVQNEFYPKMFDYKEIFWMNSLLLFAICSFSQIMKIKTFIKQEL